MLVDILTKQPILNAEILCNGVHSPYIIKDSRYYIFYNLQPGYYDLYISAEGYVNKKFSTKIEFGESKKFIFELSFKSKNPKISNVPRMEFLLKRNKLPLKNTEVAIYLRTEIKSMKLIQKINHDDEEILLNIPENNNFILQKYIYSVPKKYLALQNSVEKSSADKKTDDNKDSSENDAENDKNNSNNKDEQNIKNNENNEKEKKSDNINDDKLVTQEMLFLGYDKKYNAYILQNKIPVDIPIGGSFFPYWELKTDEYGKLTLPILPKIMLGGHLVFEIFLDEQKKTIKLDLNKINLKTKKLCSKTSFK